MLQITPHVGGITALSLATLEQLSQADTLKAPPIPRGEAAPPRTRHREAENVVAKHSENIMNVEVKLLGGFEIKSGDAVIDERTRRSRKMWLLLQYLIVNKEREVSNSELIDIFWQNESNPENALKTLVFRIRGELDKLGAGKLIINTKSAYVWNRNIDCTIDIVKIEKLYERSRFDTDAVTTLEEAAELYRGDFMPKHADENWVVPLTEYYRSLYEKIVLKLSDIYLEFGWYNKMTEICRRAAKLVPFSERLQAQYIRALLKNNEKPVAQQHYFYVRNLFNNTLGVSPSDDFSLIYDKIFHDDKELVNIRRINEKLDKTATANKTVPLCDYSAFVRMYGIERARIERFGKSGCCLILVSIFDMARNIPASVPLTRAVEKVERIIKANLMPFDIYCRYNTTQFLLLAHTKNTEAVCARMAYNYNKIAPRGAELLSIKWRTVLPFSDFSA